MELQVNTSNWMKIMTLLGLLLTGNIHMFSNVARDAHYYPRRHRNERAWTQEQEEEENRPQVTGLKHSTSVRG